MIRPWVLVGACCFTHVLNYTTCDAATGPYLPSFPIRAHVRRSSRANVSGKATAEFDSPVGSPVCNSFHCLFCAFTLLGWLGRDHGCLCSHLCHTRVDSSSIQDGLAFNSYAFPAATADCRLRDPSSWPFFNVHYNGGGSQICGMYVLCSCAGGICGFFNAGDSRAKRENGVFLCERKTTVFLGTPARSP